MSQEPANAISDTQPSPWVCCPFCGEIWIKLVAVLERGRWVTGTDGREHYEIQYKQPPIIGGYRSASPEMECTSCQSKFGLSDVGYNVTNMGDADSDG